MANGVSQALLPLLTVQIDDCAADLTSTLLPALQLFMNHASQLHIPLMLHYYAGSKGTGHLSHLPLITLPAQIPQIRRTSLFRLLVVLTQTT